MENLKLLVFRYVDVVFEEYKSVSAQIRMAVRNRTATTREIIEWLLHPTDGKN